MIEPFKSGGGLRTANTVGIDFLGSIPFDAQVVKTSDTGNPVLNREGSSRFSKALDKGISEIVARI